jgi:hypothetical protein
LPLRARGLASRFYRLTARRSFRRFFLSEFSDSLVLGMTLPNNINAQLLEYIRRQ